MSRRFPKDSTGGCVVPDYETATPKQRFYAGYQFYRMEPGDAAQFPEDVMAKVALAERGVAGDDQSFEVQDDQRYWPNRPLGTRAYAEAAARRGQE